MKWLVLAAMLLLAGCASSRGPNDEAAIDFCTHPAEGVPALCFAADLQSHTLVVVGSECCSAHWENLTVSASGNSKCQIVTPGSGLIVAGDRVHVLGGDVDCNVKLSYDGVPLGYWGLGPKAQQAAAASLSRTWTADAKPMADPKPTPEPAPEPKQDNATAPSNNTGGKP